MIDQPHIIGEINSFSDLHSVLRARAEQLNMSRETIDHLTGLQPGYSSKLLAPRPIRKLSDFALGLLLPVLGIKLCLVECPQRMARIAKHIGTRKGDHVRQGGAVSFQLSRRFLKRIAREGGENSRKYMTREQATELARRAGRAGAAARWKRRRVAD
jgi:general stress protein YciG